MMARWLIALGGIVFRELLRFVHQRERLLSALFRPLLWLVVFSAGFRAALGVAIAPPYETYITYETYVLPGLIAMVLLFNGMQTSLSMVHDRETGSMRTLLIAPLPRWSLLVAKLLAGTILSLVQAYAFLAIAWAYGVTIPPWGYIQALPALILAGTMLGAAGLLLSSTIRQLENFAGVMNFVIFPAFFISTALYPQWKIADSAPWLAQMVELNPFTYAVELIRFALYGQLDWVALAWVSGSLVLFTALAVWGYDPSRGLLRRKVGD